MRKVIQIFQKIDSKRLLTLGLLFVLALVVRVYFTWDEYQAYGTDNWADAANYLKYGKSFASGDFYPSFAGRPYLIVGPVIPLLVALATKLAGDPILPMLLLNCFLSSLLVFVLFSLGRRLVNVATGYFMALWAVFNFGLIRLNFQILKEPLLTLIIPLILLCLLHVHEKKKENLNLISGILLYSLLIHTDERFIAYFPIILIALVLMGGLPSGLKKAGLALLILMLSMVPWTLRNYKQHDQLVILTPRTTTITSRFWGRDLGKLHFSAENGVKAHPGYRRSVQEAQAWAIEEGVEFKEYGKYEKYWKAFWHYWKPANFRLTFIQYGFRGIKWSLGHNLSSLLFYGIYLPFYLAGCVLAFIRRRWRILLLAGLPLFHSLVHTLMVWPMERYRLPLDFMVALVALWFVKEVFWKNSGQSISTLEEA
ncbi:MAG: glycosyltransferase family 39 protein [Candidatus Cloacimonetes bacterium]|nr:glycosyltransferase family 39 protein [Candidatus Cloacimonadota bacterium]MDY0366063.1 glycosyltransferase family 39 protein [Candidatus Syntrophosphaera sp.]